MPTAFLATQVPKHCHSSGDCNPRNDICFEQHSIRILAILGVVFVLESSRSLSCGKEKAGEKEPQNVTNHWFRGWEILGVALTNLKVKIKNVDDFCSRFYCRGNEWKERVGEGLANLNRKVNLRNKNSCITQSHLYIPSKSGFDVWICLL